jgi:hypothetical protein
MTTHCNLHDLSTTKSPDIRACYNWVSLFCELNFLGRLIESTFVPAI